MSVNLQRNIRQNVADMHNYVKELYQWSDEITTKGVKPRRQEQQQHEIPIRGQAYQEEQSEVSSDRLKNAKVEKSMLRKDKIPLVDYYKNWDKVDVDEELKEIDNGAVSNVVKEAFSENKGKDKSKKVSLQVVGGTRKRVSALDDIKNDGNEYYKQREYTKAIDKYTEALNRIDSEMETFDQNIDLYLSLLTNRSQCFLNQHEFSKGLKDCNKAISIKHDYPKAYFRKSQILKKMEDWRGAYQAITEGIQWASQDPSFNKELGIIQTKIKEIKKQMLQNMNVVMMPAEQSFIRIQVKDDTEEEAPKKPTSSERSSASTTANKSSKDISPAKSLVPEGPSTMGRLAAGDHLTSEFIKLKNIDGEIAKRASGDDQMEAEPLFEPIASAEHSNIKKGKRVRFNPKEMPPTSSNRVPKGQRSTQHLRSALKESTLKIGVTDSKKPVQPNKDQASIDSPEQDLVNSAMLTAYKDRASNIATTTQFWDFWRSFKNEPETQEWFLREIGHKKFKSIFAKGIESDVFWSIFTVLKDHLSKDKELSAKFIAIAPTIDKFKLTIKMMSKREKTAMKEYLSSLIRDPALNDILPEDLLSQYYLI